MHELGIVMNVLEQADAAAAEYNAEKVMKVTMEVGEVSSIVPDLFIDAFNWAKKKTDYLKDAELEMIIIEGRTYCKSCGGTYRTTEHGKKCPYCGSVDTYLLTGDQVIIKDIEALFKEATGGGPDPSE
ncbi:MAG: hydrogenase maturation nickel metallochaperone HypA [Clostridia bacterium]|nr:hydrogenase maturation nickel metallochaperone HypA [Clostridia bacterium]